MVATGAECASGPMHLHHAAVGNSDVDYQVRLQPDSPDHRLEVYTPSTPAARDALRALASESDGSPVR